MALLSDSPNCHQLPDQSASAPPTANCQKLTKSSKVSDTQHVTADFNENQENMLAEENQWTQSAQNKTIPG